MRIKSVISLLLLMVLLAGCTREDMSDCFTQSGLRLSLRYKQDQSELPLERIDLYLFDAKGRFVGSLTDTTGPFNSSTIYTFPLAAGNYTAVAWGNQNHSFTISPETFVPGETTIDQARLILAELSAAGRTSASILTTGPDKILFHAIEKNIHVAPDRMSQRTMPLFRNTKEINLGVRFVNADGTPCQNPGHQLNALIRSNDGIHNFENSLDVCPDLLYKPATLTNIQGGSDVSFRKMRLLMDEPSEIILTWPDATDTHGVFYRKSLMTLLQGTGYNSQQALDQTDIYNIELRFRCDDENPTHVTVRIFVNGWEYVEITDDV